MWRPTNRVPPGRRSFIADPPAAIPALQRTRPGEQVRYNKAMSSLSPLLKRITRNPAICHGQPTIRGLRYPVQMLLELLSGGMTGEQLLADYPDLEREDILAAFAFAARLTQVKHTEPFPLSLQ